MPLRAETLAFLKYLQSNPLVRAKIRASPSCTLLYAGSFFKPAWKEIAELKRANRSYAHLETLPDVLGKTPVPGTRHASLLAYIQHIEQQVPWKPDGVTLWRVVSGIFASNAVGKISFQIGSNVTRIDKVFASTEVAVLARNPNVDPVSRDLLEYYRRCINSGQADINVGFVAG
jgi:hypothetical protein